MELLTNLTSTLFDDIPGADILLAINGTLDPVPSVLSCMLKELSAVVFVLEENRIKLIQEIQAPRSSPKVG